jgi:hypothetical protein
MLRHVSAAALILCLTVSGALAWGAAGHSIVAELAERRLSPCAASQIVSLLDGRKSLASLSSWADEVQAPRPTTRNWHFVNIPFDADGYDASRDCSERPGGDCIVRAIDRVRSTLSDRSKPKPERVEALMFLIHLIADIHQPMHAVDRHDAGGTQLQVKLLGQPMSLHNVWDFAIIDRRTFYWGEYVRALEQTLAKAKEDKSLTGGTPTDWANEAHRIAVAVAYKLPDNLELGDDYIASARPVIDRQLTLAGLRLARVLNDAFAPTLTKKGQCPRRFC